MCSASSANSTRRCGWIAQPTTRRENRSSQIQPALPRPDVRDVGAPALVGVCSVEGAGEDVGRHRTLVVTVRRAPVPLEGQADQPHVLQQSGDPRPANWDPVLPELLVDPRAAVRSAAGGMDRPDAYLQPVVVPLLRARAPMRPGVVTAGRHL